MAPLVGFLLCWFLSLAHASVASMGIQRYVLGEAKELRSVLGGAAGVQADT